MAVCLRNSTRSRLTVKISMRYAERPAGRRAAHRSTPTDNMIESGGSGDRPGPPVFREGRGGVGQPMLPDGERLVAAAATAAVAVTGTAAVTAEVAVAGQEPEDDEQDDGVLIQAEETSVAVTHNIAPFLRAQRYFCARGLAHGWRRAGPGWVSCALPRPNLSYAAPGKMVSE